MWFFFSEKYAPKIIVLSPDFWANASVEEHEADVGEDLGQEGLGNKVVVDDVDLEKSGGKRQFENIFFNKR